MLPPLLPCYSLKHLGRQLLNQPFLVYIFSLSTRFFPVSHIASTTLVWFLSLICLSSALPDPIFVPVPFPSSLLLLFPSSLPSPFPSPSLFSARLRVSTPPVFVPFPAPSPLPSPFPSCVPSFPFTPVLVPAPSPSPTLSPSPSPFTSPSPSPFPPPTPIPTRPRIRSFPFFGHAYPLGAIRVYRHRSLRNDLSGARKCHPLLPCCSLHHLGRQPLNNPFLKYNEPRPSSGTNLFS